jgi:lipopolysaccharide export system protein LptA
MRRLLSASAWLLLALLLPAAPAVGQGVVCNLVDRPGSSARVSNAGLPTEFGIIYRAHFICDGGQRTILADTATYSRASGQIELFGNVNVTEPERVMTAARATYFTQLRQMAAMGGVVVRDRNTGSVVQGDLLNYWEQTAERPQSQMTATATTGLARAVLLRERATEPGRRDTTTVDAAQIHIVGEETFRGIGNAVMTRDSLRATGAVIEYAQGAGYLVIAGDGRVELPRYELRGDSITATVGEGEELRDVLARHSTTLQTEEMNLAAPAVRLFLENGEVHRLVAMQWPDAQAPAGDTRARAVSEDFRMEADSLDVLASGQQLREAIATGAAFVQRVLPDSLRTLLPETDSVTAALIASDWMRGDTVRATFTDGPAPAEEGAAAERVLERLSATGGPAQTMYLSRDDNAAADTRMSIAYLVGEFVEVTFSEGAVSTVLASEDVRGVYLQPEEVARRTGGQPAAPAAVRPTGGSR